jgi:hypothetical protein
MNALRERMAAHRATVGFAAGLITATILGGGVVALAAIPSTANGAYTGCVNKTSGAVRIIDRQAGKHCTTRERTISWSKGYRYRGAWKSGTAYAVLDVVTYRGSSYVARSRSTGRSPATATSIWGLLAAAGRNGVAGLGASAFSDDNGFAPVAGTSSAVVKQVTITTSQPGKLVIVNATVENVHFNNTGVSPVTYFSGVFVDGVPVPATGALQPGQIPAASGDFIKGPWDLGPGSIPNIPAGTHTVAIEVFTNDTSVNYETGGQGRLLVIATG